MSMICHRCSRRELRVRERPPSGAAVCRSFRPWRRCALWRRKKGHGDMSLESDVAERSLPARGTLLLACEPQLAAALRGIGMDLLDCGPQLAAFFVRMPQLGPGWSIVFSTSWCFRRIRSAQQRQSMAAHGVPVMGGRAVYLSTLVIVSD